ncbi:MAG: hypothetical protein GVY25_14215 [Bacteroidetes bacterium]|nr:hypothetical protein [Bacteroidota bacterium]
MSDRTPPVARRVAYVLCLLAVFAGTPLQAQPTTPNETPVSIAATPVGGSDAFRPPALDAPPADPWLGMDKAKHVGGSLLLTLSTQYVLVVKADWAEGDALPVSMATAAGIGVAKEVYDRYAGPTAFFSTRDLVADAVGIALGVVVVLL